MDENPNALSSRPLVLVVSEDPSAGALLERWLVASGVGVELHASAESLLVALSRTLPDAICLDSGLPAVGEHGALPLVRSRHRTVPIIVVTADRGPEAVIAAIGGGAIQYLAKPPDREQFVHTVVDAARQHHQRFKAPPTDASGAFRGLVGQSPPMRALFRDLQRVAESDITVLIQGEKGTGKGLIAQAIHGHSARAGGPLIAVDCAAIPAPLQEAELFGHEEGAFMGADQTRPGRFEQAGGGTLFLDQVAELAPELQAKLLRVLQERKFERVGGTRTLSSDFRLVAATHRDLTEMVAQGLFRQDLFFRLAVLELKVPPLRERGDDVDRLTDFMLRRAPVPHNGGLWSLSNETRAVLRRYPWPGNVRELGNAIERAVVVAESSEIQPWDLPARVRQLDQLAAPPFGTREPAAAPAASGDGSLADLGRAAIEKAVQDANGNLSEVTRRLGIGRATLDRRLKKYGLR